MVNPFDRTFFKFFFGFITILLVSFCVLYFANHTSETTQIDSESLTATHK